MSAFAYRYVGREALPARLTEFDLRQFFQLTSADIAAIRARFRADRHAAVGLQLVCLRAFGRPLDRFAAVPRNLLRYLCDAFSAPTLSIGSIVLAWNTHRMNDAIERLRKDGTKIEDAWLRRMGPGHFGHVNFRGIFSFGVERYPDVLIQGRRAAIKQAVI